jgi:hypothetical protein
MNYQVKVHLWAGALLASTVDWSDGRCGCCRGAFDVKFVKPIGLVCAYCYFRGEPCQEPGCLFPAVDRREFPRSENHKRLCRVHYMKEIPCKK